MYICVCRAVTERDIESAVACGARRLRDLRVELGVTEECGRCAKCAHQCLQEALDGNASVAFPPVNSHSPFLLVQEAT